MGISRNGSGIAGQLRWAFGSVATVAVIACAGLIYCLDDVGDALVSIREDVSATRDGLGLALAVREQYIHEAHTIIVGDASHVAHHDQWVSRVQESADELRGRIPVGEEWRLRRIGDTSEAINTAFASEVVPGVLSDDVPRVSGAHERILAMSARAGSHSDALVEALERRMQRAQADAEAAFELALLAGGIGIFLALVLALLHSWRLRRTIVEPLGELTRAAHIVGAGGVAVGLAVRGDGELGTLAVAFERMLLQLREREQQLVQQERMVAIGELAGGVAHEIDDPLGVMRDSIRLMMNEEHDGELGRELRILDEEVGCCQRIVEDLLTYASTPRIEATRVSSRELVEEVVDRFFRSHPPAAARLIRAGAT